MNPPSYKTSHIWYFQKKNSSNIRRLSALVLVAGLIVFGCTGQYGWARIDRDLETVFEENRILEDYNYYYSGPYYNPRGIIGIHKDVTLESKFWKPVDVTEQRLRGWKWFMNAGHSLSFRQSPKARYLFDQNGDRIGFWYSKWSWTVIRRAEGNTVMVYTPFDEDRNSPAWRRMGKR
ncbi:MAG: hypothetical protein HKM93_18120 [Desulfobacteraceae bacterium]|nr:hypothetical protein [Desulfobacteraceae bacterium]